MRCGLVREGRGLAYGRRRATDPLGFIDECRLLVSLRFVDMVEELGVFGSYSS